MALVYSISSKHHKTHEKYRSTIPIDFEDLFGAGIEGLHIAIQRFDSYRGIKFSTYAWGWIESKVKSEIRKNSYPLKTQTYAPISPSAFKSRDDSNNAVSYNLEDSKNFYSEIEYNSLIESIDKILTKPQDKKIFKMFFIQELHIHEISKKLKISASIVVYRLKKIRQNIKENLK